MDVPLRIHSSPCTCMEPAWICTPDNASANFKTTLPFPSQPEDFSEQRQVLRPEDHNDGDEIADCKGSTTQQNTDIAQAFIAQTQIGPEAESDHTEMSEGSRNRYDRARIGD